MAVSKEPSFVGSKPKILTGRSHAVGSRSYQASQGCCARNYIFHASRDQQDCQVKHLEQKNGILEQPIKTPYYKFPLS